MSGATPTEIVHNMTVRTVPEIRWAVIMIVMMMIVMIMMIIADYRLENDTEEVTIREGESLSLGCQVIAGITKPCGSFCWL